MIQFSNKSNSIVQFEAIQLFNLKEKHLHIGGTKHGMQKVVYIWTE